jgi:hypothetical protein
VKVIKLEIVKRSAEAVKCTCGGYAERTDVMEAEDKEHGCGRHVGCCARAFVCGLCGASLVGSAEAPEME